MGCSLQVGGEVSFDGEEINRLELVKFRKFGKSALSYYKLKERDERD